MMPIDSPIHAQKNRGNFKAWLLATRPQTLPMYMVPIAVGTTLARHQVEHLNWGFVVIAVLCSVLIQIGTHFVNDALDFKKGTDAQGRLTSRRVTQEGPLSLKQVLAIGRLCFALSLLAGVPLMLAGGWPLVLALFLSVLCGYCYTGGPWPLAYTGIGGVFILIFFGWVSTGSVYYLQTGTVDGWCLLAATQIGLLAIVPHNINNLRDHLSDARVNKRTLAVRFGPYFARWEITILSFAPFVLGLLWVFAGRGWMAGLPLLAFPMVRHNVQAIWQTEPSPRYSQFLAISAMCQLLFGCLLVLGDFL